jgi:hypothetical protein
VVKISASFGSDVWDAQNYGQIMYAIRTRSGTVYLKLKRNFGDLSALQVCERALVGARAAACLWVCRCVWWVRVRVRVLMRRHG